MNFSRKEKEKQTGWSSYRYTYKKHTIFHYTNFFPNFLFSDIELFYVPSQKCMTFYTSSPTFFNPMVAKYWSPVAVRCYCHQGAEFFPPPIPWDMVARFNSWEKIYSQMLSFWFAYLHHGFQNFLWHLFHLFFLICNQWQ